MAQFVRSTRHVVMIAFPGVEVLDVTEPLSVFARTVRGLRQAQGRNSRRTP